MTRIDSSGVLAATLRWICLVAAATTGLSAAQFQFGTMVRAGINGAQDWELAVGNSSGALPPNANTAQVQPHYTNGRDNEFEISYTKATNTATLMVRTRTSGPGSGRTFLSYNPIGGSLLPAAATWTIPVGGLYLRAVQIPAASSISLSNLRLSGAISILQPIQQTTMTAAQNNTPGGSLVRQSADIVFRTTGSGDWKLEGEFTMTGVAQNGSQPGAKRSELQFGFNAIAEAPEPATVFGAGLGLSAIVWFHRRRNAGTKAVAKGSSADEGSKNQGPKT